MATIKKFEAIEAWKVLRDLCARIGILIDQGSFKKSYRPISRIESSSRSIMDTIAEGFERGTRCGFIQFSGYSKGSCGELRSQLSRALDTDILLRNNLTNSVLWLLALVPCYKNELNTYNKHK